MSAGFFTLLKQITIIAKQASMSIDDVSTAAAKVSAQSTALIIDDTAVTPRYVDGLSPKRELPIIWRITLGSFTNKLIIVLPIITVLGIFASWIFPFLLILGGLYLSYEGVKAVLDKMNLTQENVEGSRIARNTKSFEKKIVSDAIKTDLVLSMEIMLVSFSEVPSGHSILWNTIVLILVAIAMTLLVYGVVGVFVKIDDFGLFLLKKKNKIFKKSGFVLLKSMPHIFSTISFIGILAMLWVGGGLFAENLNKIGFNFFEKIIENVENLVNNSFLQWVFSASISLCIGVVIGILILSVVFIVKVIVKKLRKQ